MRVLEDALHQDEEERNHRRLLQLQDPANFELTAPLFIQPAAVTATATPATATNPAAAHQQQLQQQEAIATAAFIPTDTGRDRLRLPPLTPTTDEFALHPSRPFVTVPRTPEEQRIRTAQQIQLALGTRIPPALPTPPPAHRYLDFRPAENPRESTFDYFSLANRALEHIHDIEQQASSSSPFNNMPSAGNIMAEQPRLIPEHAVTAPDNPSAVSNGHADPQQQQQERPSWREEVKHFRLRNHLPEHERIGKINPIRQFFSSVFEAEFHTFFFMLELTIFGYVVYLALANAGIWPVEFNFAAAYLFGMFKGVAFGLIVLLGFLRFGRSGRTISNRRKQRVATPDEEAGQFRIEVAFSIALYMLLLTIFWENLPHAQVTPESQRSASIRAIRFVSDKIGTRSTWDKFENFMMSFAYDAANTVSAVSESAAGAIAGESGAASARKALGGNKTLNEGVINGLLGLVGIDMAKIFGHRTLAERIDGFINNYMGWELHPVYPW